jgi:hypothetical protein
MNPSERFETGDLPGWRLTAIAAGVLVIGIAALLWVLVLDGAGSPQLVGPPNAVESSAIESGLITSDQAQIRQQDQRASLSRYSWVDRSQGIVSIPIEQAMDLTARKQP